MSRIIDADSHFMEPLDLWERYIEPEFRARCLRFTQDPHTGTHAMLVNESKQIRGVGEFSMEDMLGVGVGYGQKEAGSGLGSFDFSTRLIIPSKTWTSVSPTWITKALNANLSIRPWV